MTPYQLWQIKLGLVEPEVTAAMLHGTQLEPQARAAYEALTGHVMQPLVLVDGEYSASLDGLTLSGDRVLEIKCPFSGRDSTLWKTVAEGRLPEHYELQVQHQLHGAGADVADVYVFDGTEGSTARGAAAARYLATDSRRLGRIHALRTRGTGAAADRARHAYPR